MCVYMCPRALTAAEALLCGGTSPPPCSVPSLYQVVSGAPGPAAPGWLPRADLQVGGHSGTSCSPNTGCFVLFRFLALCAFIHPGPELSLGKEDLHLQRNAHKAVLVFS